MHKHLNLFWTSIIALASLSQTACTAHDPAAEVAPAVQATTEAADALPADREPLLNAMAADPLVREDYRTQRAYLAQCDAWLKTATVAEREALLKPHPTDAGQTVYDPAHTPAQIKAYQAYSDRVNRQLKARYPQLTQLSPDEAGELYGELYARLDALAD